MAKTPNTSAPGPMTEESPHSLDTSKPKDVPKRQWYVDEIVVAAFAFLGFGGAVFLPVRFGWEAIPPIVVSFLLATGLAALTYRYLGGIQGASFTVGTLKLGGALAALVGIAWFINGQLVPQVQPVQVWDVYGKVIKENKDAMNELVGADFTVFPANANPAPNGDFHLRFIADPANPVYVTIKHNTNGTVTYGPVTIPLEPNKLREFDPGFKITNKLISLARPVILPESRTPGAYNKDAPPLEAPEPSKLSGYKPPAQSSAPPN